VKTPVARKPQAKKAPRVEAGATVRAVVRSALALAVSPALGRSVLAALVAGGFGAASWRARAHVLEQPSAQIDRLELARAPLPSFLSEKAREDLAALPLPQKVCAFHPGLVPALASELRKVSWVESVDSLALDFTGEGPDGERLLPRVHFALKVARPIARIEERGTELLVSRSRRRIPPDRVVPAARSLPLVRGLKDDVEREKQLDEALSVVAALEKDSVGSRAGLVTVELAGHEATLVLASGVRVELGPMTPLPGLTVEARIAQLDFFLRKGPPLEQVEKISLRWDDPVYVLRPVTAALGAH
jgi:hypothetical protein